MSDRQLANTILHSITTMSDGRSPVGGPQRYKRRMLLFSFLFLAGVAMAPVIARVLF